jgi:hypothetical protein
MTLPSTYTKITFPSTNDAVIVPTESNNLNIANEDVPPINTKFFNMGVVNPFDNKLIQTILIVSQNVALRVSTTQLNIHKTTGDGFNLFVGDKVILLTKDDAKYELTITENFTNASTALKFNAVIFDTPIGDGAIITISQSDQFNEGNRKTRGQVAGFTISPSTITKNGIGISSWSNDPTFNEVDNTTLPTSQAVKEYVLSKKDIIETELIKVNDDVINKSAFLHDDGLRFTRIEDGSEMGQINYDGVDTITFNSNGGSSTGATRLDFQVNSVSKMLIDNEGKVGIGTASPNVDLQIGEIYPASGVPFGELSIGADNASIYVQGGGYGAVNTASLDLVGGYANHNVTNSIRIKGIRTSSGVGVNGSRLDFINMARGTEGDTLMSMVNSGKVGIGTTSPSRQLEVSNTGDAIIRIAGDSDNDVGETGDAVIEMTTDAANHGWSIRSANIGGGTGDFKVNTFISSVESTKLLIDRDGNVGIGTTNPAQKLDVVGKISLKDAGDSIFVGYQAGLNDDASANLNVGVGYQALYSNTTGSYNAAHGYRALYSNTTGESNSAVGYQALYFNTTGAYNTAHGFRALYSNTTGNSNSAHGYLALYSNTTGNSNTATGIYALYFNTTGANNTAHGHQALYSNTTGNSNTAVGIYSSEKNTTGTSNVALGYATLMYNITGNNNIAVGNSAGRFIDGGANNTSTSNSVFLGYNTRALAIGQTNQIVIGVSAVGLGSNTAILGNSSITKTQLQGNVGIGTASPQNKLDIVGSLGRGIPVTKTANFTVAATENWLIMNGEATITIRLPLASNFSGRELMIKNIAAFTVISDATNVIGLNNNETTNAILPATAGSWCTLVSNGSFWVTMMNG